MIRDWSTNKGYKQKQENKKRKIYLFILAILMLGGAYFWLFPFFLGPGVEIENENEEIKEQEPPKQVKGEGKRKKIYDRNMRELAVSFKIISVYVKPLEFDNIEKTVSLLAQVLELEEQSLLEKLKAQRSFKWLGENILEEKAREIADLNLTGVYFYEQQGRFYPEGSRIANIIGEVKDGNGLSGIEAYYDSFLRYDTTKQETQDKEDVGGLVLTVDAKMQALLEKKMKALHTMTGAFDEEVFMGKQTVVNSVVMDVASGEILAYVQFPPMGSAGLEQDNKKDGREPLLELPMDTGRLSLLFKVAAAYNRGETVISGEEDLAVDVKYLYPRHMKKLRKKQKPIHWSRMEDGSYTSRWLAKALSVEDEKALEARNELFSVRDFVEQGVPCSVDLPGGNQAGDTGLGLLCGVAALVNGGKSIKPHFLRGFLAEKDDFQEWKLPEQEKIIVEPEASQKFIRFLKESVGVTDSMMVAEVIYPPENFVLPNPDNESEDQKKQDGEIAQPVIDNCRAIVLAAAPLRKPELAMFLNLEQGQVDLGKPSPFKQKSEEFLKEALRLKRQKKSTTAKHGYTAEDYRKWLLEREQLPGSGKADKGVGSGLMRNVKGMSLRKALQILEKIDVKVMIEGSGRVKSQHPAAGSKLTNDTVVVLKAEVVK